MKIFHYIKNIARNLGWMLAFLLSYQGYSQMGTFGNTYVGNGQEITIHDAQQNFLNGGSGVLPGIVGTQRTASQGYLSFFGTSSWISASDNAHVDGYAKTYMTTPFTFPIGDNGKFRPAAVSTASVASPADAAYYGVSGTTATTSNIAGGTEPVLPSGGPYATTSKASAINTVDNVEYWDINGATAANITLTWDATSAVTTMTNSQLSALSILGWNGSQWVVIPSTFDATSILGGASSLTAGSITTTASIVPNTYSVYTLGAIVVCPVLTNSGTSTDNINPTTCGGSNGSIKICGLVANSTDNTISYDKNSTAATALTNQTADASGCLTISGLTAGAYTNIKVSTTNCPLGSNTVSATLTDPSVPVSPTATSATPTSVCSAIASTLSGTCSIGTITWFTDAALTTAVGGSTVNPVSTTTYYGSCVSGTCKSPSVSVIVTVTPCANPDQPTATAGIASTIPVLANDKNPDGTSVTDLTKITTPTVSTAPTKGTATVNPDGTIKYTPNAGTSGTDTFVYSICDINNPTVCDTATVTVTISPAPAPAASPDASPATAGLLTNISILSNDKNPDGTYVTDLTKITTPIIATAPTKGTATVKADGTVDYTPNAGTSGTDTFSYTICDKAVPANCTTAIVSVVISPVTIICAVSTTSPNFMKN